MKPAEVSQETETFLPLAGSTSQQQRMYAESIKERVQNEETQCDDDEFYRRMKEAKQLVENSAALSPSLGKGGRVKY